MSRPIKRVAVPIGVPHLERAVGGFLESAAGHGPWRLATSPESPILSLAGNRRAEKEM